MSNPKDFCGTFRVRLKANGDYVAEQLDVENKPIPGKHFSSEHWPIFERELRMRLRTGRRDPVRRREPQASPGHACFDETATVVNGNWVCHCPKG